MIKTLLKSIIFVATCGGSSCRRRSGRLHFIRLRPKSGLKGNSEAPSIPRQINHGFSLNIHTPMHFAFESEHGPRTATVVSPCRKITDSMAVVKDSENPYQDFKASMQRMVFEREIDTDSDLQELLTCFLKLNSPYNHPAIAQAFLEIWDGVRRK